MELRMSGLMGGKVTNEKFKRDDDKVGNKNEDIFELK
jgi:hypothetical protein